MSNRLENDIFDEITQHLLTDEKPSIFITSISKDVRFAEYPFSMLWQLKSTEQSKKYHPEGSVWNHTLLVLDEAAKVRKQSKDEKVFMWAALLHDIGKPETTRERNGKITSYDHDKAGEKLSAEFLRYFTTEESFIEKVSALVRYHMHMLYILKALPYGDVNNMLRRVDRNDIALLCRCDRLGRTGADVETEEKEYDRFVEKLKEYDSK
jgi:putative nucleotidyltransferase with HDIG domain